MLDDSIWKADCPEIRQGLAYSFSARLGFCGYGHVVWLKEFCGISADIEGKSRAGFKRA